MSVVLYFKTEDTLRSWLLSPERAFWLADAQVRALTKPCSLWLHGLSVLT